MVNPTIYVSCIKKFWASVSIKKSNDAMKLQALIDRKKVIITEGTIRQNLRLDDANGIDCLPNEEIFAELARIGYEKPLVRNVDSLSNFIMYPRFLQVMINAQVEDLSSHNTKYTSPALTQKVFSNIRRFSKGFSEVETPLFDAMLVPQQVHAEINEVEEDEDDNEVPAAPTPPSPTPATIQAPPLQEPIHSPPQAQSAQPSSPPPQQPFQTADISMTLLNKLMETCVILTQKVANLEQDKIAQALEITKLKQRARRLEKKRRTKHYGLKRLKKVGGGIVELDANEDVTLVDVDAEVAIDANIQGRMAESQAKVYNLDLQHFEKVLSMHDTDEAEPAEVEEVLEVVTTARLMTEVVTTGAPITTATEVPKPSTPRKKRGVVIQDPEETTVASVIVHIEIDMDEAFARQLKAKLNTNINWNEVIEQVQRKERQDNDVMRYQALKRKPLTEAQARKNMMIYLKNMARFKMDFLKGMTYSDIRPIFEKHYNSIKAFLEKGEEEVTIQEEGSKRKSENLKQDTSKKQRIDEEVEELKTHLQIIANDDDDVYTEATPLALKMILLVEKKYPLTHFTLEQMLSNVRLKVEEESEMSLELPSDDVAKKIKKLLQVISAVRVIIKTALLHSSHMYHEAKTRFAKHGVKFDNVEVDLAAMMGQKDKAVSTLTKVKGKNIIIATGSDVKGLPGITIDEKRIVSSTGALALTEIPKKLVVIGAGYIGLEMGSVWARLGAEVTVVEFAPDIVPSMDGEVRKQFQRTLQKQHMKFILKTKVVSVDTSTDIVKLTLEPSTGGDQTVLEADVVLVSAGRSPFTSGLGLETIGVETDKIGRIHVDGRFSTKVKGVFAIGDVIPGPMLAHKAEEDGIACVEFIAGKEGHVDYDKVPGVCYTHPEVASVGKTEEQVKELGIAYRVGKFPMLGNSRAKSIDDAEGLVKIIAEKETDKDIARTCHAHPTLSEAVKEAAMATYDKAIHI
uniref:Dihydrolipoyl dehydrogenase 1, mitochondrial n=1 Tax=Tanacetum cinerariifolium TaxID=118510 RepID=A0A6L2NFV9_TANCI|nr:dihydrolipoyl dehydrogenase 1, mitochondrial [Tanacetum cinerariifolium]